MDKFTLDDGTQVPIEYVWAIMDRLARLEWRHYNVFHVLHVKARAPQGQLKDATMQVLQDYGLATNGSIPEEVLVVVLAKSYWKGGIWKLDKIVRGDADE